MQIYTSEFPISSLKGEITEISVPKGSKLVSARLFQNGIILCSFALFYHGPEFPLEEELRKLICLPSQGQGKLANIQPEEMVYVATINAVDIALHIYEIRPSFLQN
jgi:hypothetical protein